MSGLNRKLLYAPGITQKFPVPRASVKVVTVPPMDRDVPVLSTGRRIMLHIQVLHYRRYINLHSAFCPFHSYSLSGGHGQFSINPATGQIITSSLLDREERANYQLLVVATDGGQPQGLSSSATVSVTVADINDNPPRFHHHPYVTHIPASTAAGLDFCLTFEH